jgi:hypothetical protein
MTRRGSPWPLYESHSAFVLGFHGCDRALGEAILQGEPTHLLHSRNDYDWLGHGIYFWERSPGRALEFAQERAKGGMNSRGVVNDPFVIGAIIDLKHCLDLTERSALIQLEDAFHYLEDRMARQGWLLPVNSPDLRLRRLDCAVVEALHALRRLLMAPEYDSVRGMFTEGSALFPGAGFRSKDHVQICVRTPACIKGYFRPIAS